MVCPKCTKGNIRVATDVVPDDKDIWTRTAFCDTCTTLYKVETGPDPVHCDPNDPTRPALRPDGDLTLAQIWREADVEYDVSAAMEQMRKQYPLLDDHLAAMRASRSR